MKDVLPKKFFELIALISKLGKIYIVGGCVRDNLIDKSFCSDDIDICSNIDTDKIIEVLKGSEFKTIELNKKLGTIEIYCKEFQCEYTRWRSEKYNLGGHSPSQIDFIDDIYRDALRRDFTCNSIYYDIKDDSYIDCFNSICDIENKMIRVVPNPDGVFCVDGLRLCRLCRFASKLSFDVDIKSFKEAFDNRYLLKDISYSRIEKEIELLLDCSNFGYGLFIMNKLQLWQAIFFDEVLEIPYKYCLDVKKENRLVALGIDIALELSKLCNGQEYLKKAKYYIEISNKTLKQKVLKLASAVKEFGNLAKKNYMMYLSKNFDDLDVLFDLLKNDKNFDNLKSAYKKAISKNLPLSLNQLNINGNDIIQCKKCKGAQIKDALHYLHEFALKSETNDKSELLKALDLYIKEKKL